MKKKATFLLAIILILSLVTACSNNNTSNTNNTTPTNNTGNNNADGTANNQGNEQPSEDQGPPTPLTAITQSQTAWPLDEDWLVWDILEEASNVELDISSYQGNWWDAIPLIIAGGDMPDLMWMSGSENFGKYGQQGALVNLMDHMDKMPNLEAFLDENPESLELLLSPDGALYIQPVKDRHLFDSVFLYRQDIFEQHGIDVPKNYDEVHDVLLELKELYPDSTPYFAPGFGFLNRLFPSFDTHHSFYYNRDAGEYRYGPIEDNYKKVIEMLATWYQEGLIPQEFGNVNAQKRNELVFNNNTFFVPGYFNHMSMYNDPMRGENPDFNMTVLDPPAGVGDKGYHEYQYTDTSGWTISSTTKNLDAALRFIDSFYKDGMSELLSWGKEDVTYELVNGEKKFLPQVPSLNDRTILYGLGSSGAYGEFDDASSRALLKDEELEPYERGAENVGPPIFPTKLNDGETIEVDVPSQAIHTYVKENVSRFIIGSRPLSEWDQYVDEIKRLGVDDIIATYQKAHDRFVTEYMQ